MKKTKFKNSIKIKLFIGILIFSFFLVTLGSILNLNFFEDYYMSKKKEFILESAKQFDEKLKSNLINNENIYTELEKLVSNIGGNIIITDYKGNSVISSSFNNIRMQNGRGRGNYKTIDEINLKNIIDSGYYFEEKIHPRYNTNFLYMGYRLYDGDVLWIETPIEAIKLSAEIANKFNFIIGIISLTIGGIIAYIFANKFTKDIIELNRVAKNISNLKFDDEIYINSSDEIGMLALSLGQMSKKLKETIGKLESANIKLKKDIDIKDRIDKMRKEFISNVSHELKTPISLIQGYAIALKQNIFTNSEKKEFYVDVIIDESDKMDKLVKDLLNLSELDSKMYKININEFDISSLIDIVLNKYKKIIKEKSLIIKLEKPDIVMVKADELRIEQVVTNYLNNAINHVKNPNIIKIKIDELDNKVRVSIYNTGDKISDEDIPKLWMSFYKVDKARTRDYGGSGLGLSIVKSIMEMHNGNYGVENIDNGVNFYFELFRKRESN